MALMKTVDRLYGWFLTICNSLQHVVLLAIRLYWGWQFWQDGTGKLANIPKVVEYFASIGVPMPQANAYFVGALEATGGVLLILGLGSRLIALPLTINMIMAYVFGDREALGSIFSDPDKFYAAAPYTYLFASLLILVFGPGMFSLDYLIARWRKKRATAS